MMSRDLHHGYGYGYEADGYPGGSPAGRDSLVDLGLEVITPPALEPITLEEMKDYLRVSNTSDDALITQYITTARKRIEVRTRRRMITQTVLQSYPRFHVRGVLKLWASPVQSVESIKYDDSNGDEQTLDPAKYRVITNRIRPYVQLKDGKSWPTVEVRNANAVRIEMVAGFGDLATDVPSDLITPIKILVAMLYENRGDGHANTNLEQVDRVIAELIADNKILEVL